MSEHITFDEFQSFIYAEKLTPDIISLGRKINAHVLKCDDCAAVYNSLLDVREELETAAREETIQLNQAQTVLDKKQQRELIEEQMSGEASSSKGRNEENSLGNGMYMEGINQ